MIGPSSGRSVAYLPLPRVRMDVGLDWWSKTAINFAQVKR